MSGNCLLGSRISTSKESSEDIYNAKKRLSKESLYNLLTNNVNPLFIRQNSPARIER